ncbi:hypothetical protein A2U01_0059883 [Trifolium medium]|uniref:Uncharacterized protein n=1 Tax=Trifolium medium TaxID=97028 RepID=A0A392RST4_9FABA|nr:hypothetical protein [Trifolium medium]
MHVGYEFYLFGATKMKTGALSSRSTLSSRSRYSRGGDRRGKMQTIAGVLPALYRFFNLYSKIQSQTVIVVSFELV